MVRLVKFESILPTKSKGKEEKEEEEAKSDAHGPHVVKKEGKGRARWVLWLACLPNIRWSKRSNRPQSWTPSTLTTLAMIPGSV